MHNINLTIGGTLIVAGTTIGAGMLSLPIVAAKVGLIYTALIMFFTWYIMTYCAILMLKLLTYNGTISSIAVLSHKYLGAFFAYLAKIATIILFYALITAYIAGSSSIIHSFTGGHSWGIHVIETIVVCFLSVLFFITLKAVDYSNRILFTLKIVVFLCMIFGMFGLFNTHNIIDYGSVYNNSNLGIAHLLIFLSFGFHGSIPAVIKYVRNDYESAKKCFIFGSTCGFIIFILWIGLTLSVIPQEGPHGFNNILLAEDQLVAFTESINFFLKGASLMLWIKIFTLLAIFTSLVGVALGLIDFFGEFSIIRKMQNDKVEKFTAIFATFAIPLVIAYYNANIFINALAFGSVMLSIIAVILPSIIAIKLHSRIKMQNDSKLLFNKNATIFTTIFGIAIILAEFLH